MRIAHLLLTCEHGGNRVPARYAFLFASAHARRALAGHRGADLGALALARALARALGAPLHAATVTRLLVDLNRSHARPAVFSEFSRRLDERARAAVLERYYAPHRARVEAGIRAARGLVCHIGVHSVAPALAGTVRRADVGLLYDPARAREARFCRAWALALKSRDAALHVRRNYPYLGKSDGLTTELRRRFAETRYLGVELEVNQALLTGAAAARGRIARTLAASLATLLQADL